MLKTFPSQGQVLFVFLSMPLPQSMLVYVTWGSIKISHPHAKPEKNSLPRQGFLVSSCFLLPVLVPSCFESLFQLQPGKRYVLQHGLAVSAETIICGWNLCAVIGKYGCNSPCNCWGDVTQYFGSRQGDPGALVSLRFLRCFGLFRSFSFYTLFPPFFSFFSGWLLETPSIFLWTHWLCFPDSARPCRSDIKKPSPFWGHIFFLPIDVLWVWIV